MALIPREAPKFALRLSPDGSKLLTFEDNYDTYNGRPTSMRALSNLCGEWGPWDLGDAVLGVVSGYPTRRQAVELVGEDPVRWLEKGHDHV